MTVARCARVSLDETPYYHCVARCVRRAFLCGEDHYSGQSYEHRRQWVIDRIKHIGKLFTIDIAAYAIMSNHFHLVIRVDREQALALSNEQVIDRWLTVFSGTQLVLRYRRGEYLSPGERDAAKAKVLLWRHRLYDVSWLMRCLNEHIARRANAEDNCKGRFWEARFWSQALLGQAAYLSCMVYVDLNPIRAGVSKSASESDFTSIQARIAELNKAAKPKKKNLHSSTATALPLLPFRKKLDKKHAGKKHIPFSLSDYIDLVEWTGQIVRSNKKLSLSSKQPALLAAIGLSNKQWKVLSLDIHPRLLTALGDPNQLKRFCRTTSRHWITGQRCLQDAYPLNT